MLVAKELTVAIDFCSMEKTTMEANGYYQMFGYQHYSKYLLLCSTAEGKKWRVPKCWQNFYFWVNFFF